MGYIEYRKYIAVQKTNQDRIKRLCPDIQDKSGIYLFYRISEEGEKQCYIGKASKSVLVRTAQHLNSHAQHIDNSIIKHGLYSKDKPYGYKLKILRYADANELDRLEQSYIRLYVFEGWVLKNTESGGTTGKTLINEKKPNLKYHEGVEHGYQKCLKEIREYFEKYFDITYKHDKCFTKKGELKAVAERKMKELNEKIYANKTD